MRRCHPSVHHHLRTFTRRTSKTSGSRACTATCRRCPKSGGCGCSPSLRRAKARRASQRLSAQRSALQPAARRRVRRRAPHVAQRGRHQRPALLANKHAREQLVQAGDQLAAAKHANLGRAVSAADAARHGGVDEVAVGAAQRVVVLHTVARRSGRAAAGAGSARGKRASAHEATARWKTCADGVVARLPAVISSYTTPPGVRR
jgi:hypothetical protein